MKTLGEIKQTNRGFALIEFKDRYSMSCSLQQSSLAEYEPPGSSAVWLGAENNQYHKITGEPLSPRMHLDRNQVTALIKHLENWLKTNKF